MNEEQEEEYKKKLPKKKVAKKTVPGKRDVKRSGASRKPAKAGVAKKKVAGAGQPKKGEAVKRGATAQELALRQREISVSEFFTKNRHLLGFDNPRRALLAAVKEAVDNSLDACEESGRLPEISVELREVAEDRIRIIVEDNGPGIVRAQIPKIFGKLLYGSKFHALKQTRGQQGIGISAAGMYGQLTTGKPVAITSRSRPGGPAHYYEIQIDTQKNQPIILKESEVEWDHPARGTRVEIELEGRYQKGRHSVDAYLQQAALANPHVDIRYLPPRGRRCGLRGLWTSCPKSRRRSSRTRTAWSSGSCRPCSRRPRGDAWPAFFPMPSAGSVLVPPRRSSPKGISRRMRSATSSGSKRSNASMPPWGRPS